MTDKKTPYLNIKVTKLPHSEVEITGELTEESLQNARAKALTYLGQHATIDGFRKGHIPEKVLVKHVGEMSILEECVEIVLGSAYPHIVTENKIDAIGRPTISITKLAPGSHAEFTIKTAVVPEVTLPDYKKIAKTITESKEEHSVDDKEIQEVINHILKSRVDHSGHDHDAMSKEEHDKEIENNMPELTDDFVKSLGDFKDVEDFKIKVKENLMKEKIHKAQEKKRLEMGEKIVAESTIDLPEILVMSELQKMKAQFTDDVSRMGVKFDDYLKHIKKTEEDIMKDWRPDAEKRAKFQLILNKIAVAENISASKEEIEKEVKHILEHYKDADAERAYIYVETMLMNQKVFELLEGENKDKKDDK